jgi:hypothetical protein
MMPSDNLERPGKQAERLDSASIECSNLFPSNFLQLFDQPKLVLHTSGRVIVIPTRVKQN